LHWSACNDHIDVCKVLLDAKADVNAKDDRYNFLITCCITNCLLIFLVY
jgi:hypothetical protein